MITTLIKNKEIREGTILFIDEPEVNLHPKAIRILINFLVKIAKLGVQIFISSHSYFVIKQLTICAKKYNNSVFCYSLLKNNKGLINYNLSDLKDGLPDNPIVKEALDMYDEEIDLEFQ